MKLYLAKRGSLWVDGGSMFGIVPYVFWEEVYPPDGENCIELGLWWVAVETKEVFLLFDPMSGESFGDTFQSVLSPEEIFSAWGKSPAEVDLVFLSHLHLDHCEGLFWKKEFLFPKAQVVVSRREWEEALCPHPLVKGDYPSSSFLQTLEKRGDLIFLEEEGELCEGVRYFPTPGHTEGHFSLHCQGEKAKLYLLGDLFPLVFQLRLPYISSFDVLPKQTYEVKKKVLEQWEEGDWLFFCHEPTHPLGRWEKGECVVQKMDYPKVFDF